MCYIIERPTPTGYFAVNYFAVNLQCLSSRIFNVLSFGPKHVDNMSQGSLNASYTLDRLRMVPCAVELTTHTFWIFCSETCCSDSHGHYVCVWICVCTCVCIGVYVCAACRLRTASR